MNQWATIPLADAGRWLSGGTPSKADRSLWSGPVPWVSPKDMKRPRIDDAIDHVSEAALGAGTQIAPANSILMVVRGMILAHTFPVGLTVRDVAFNQDIKVLVPREDLDPEFLLYWFEAHEAVFLRHVDVANHGTKRLPTESIFAMRLPVPPLDEQRRIAAVLSAIDSYSQLTAESLRALRGARSSLVDALIDAAAKAAPVRTLGEIAIHLTSGSRGWAPYYAESGALFIRITNLTRETTELDLSDRQHVLLPQGNAEGTRTKVELGDVLISITADLGIIGVVGPEVGEAYVNQHIALVRVDPARAFGPFVALALASARHGQAQFGRLNDAGAKAGLNLPAVRSLTLPVPDLAAQQDVVTKITSLDHRISAEQAVLAAVRRTKRAVARQLLGAAE